MLLFEHHLEFLSLEGGCTGLSSQNATLLEIGVQRYAKKRIAIWKTRIAIHIAIHLVSLFLSITGPSAVYYNIIQLDKGPEIGIYYTLSYFHLLLLSLGSFSRRNDRIWAFTFKCFTTIIRDCMSAIFFKTESSCFLLV